MEVQGAPLLLFKRAHSGHADPANDGVTVERPDDQKVTGTIRESAGAGWDLIHPILPCRRVLPLSFSADIACPRGSGGLHASLVARPAADAWSLAVEVLNFDDQF